MGLANKTASVHRFRDDVAAHLGNGDTVYLTPAEARKLARALNACARSVGAESFAGSAFGTVTIAVASLAR